LRRLHFINALFSQVTGHDLFLAQQIAAGLAFSLAELETQAAADPVAAPEYDAAFTAAAVKLLGKFCRDQPRHGFFHWDATGTAHSATPLFTRAEIVAGLKQLAGFRESTLLITNLRPALLPPERRATPRRQRDYEDALAFIRELAAARTVESARLQLLFL
jgi:hypothetical protein